MEKTINLDCAPGSMRPGDLIGGVIEGTGLTPKEPAAMFFGNWLWDWSDDASITDARWKEIQEITKPRITKLYNDGYIRYGDW